MFSVPCVLIHSKSPGRLLLCIVRMLVCAGAPPSLSLSLCMCVCVCVGACVRACVRALRIVSRDKIFRFKKYFNYDYYYCYYC